MTQGPRRGERFDFVPGVIPTYCAACLHKRRTAAMLADPSPIASLLPDTPASPQEAESMSEYIARQVREKSPATGATYLVHLTLATIADETGRISDRPRWQIAREAHCDTSTVIRALRWLVSHECLYRWHQQGRVTRYLFPADYVADYVARGEQPAEPAEGRES